MPGRVTGVVGRMGSGKSLYAVRRVIRHLRKGNPVATNFTLRNVPAEWSERAIRFTGWDDLLHLEGTTARPLLVVVDEAQGLAPSHKAIALPNHARWKLAQGRKFRLDFLWISQHEDRVNRVIRDLTTDVVLCQAWFGGLVMTCTTFEPEYVRKKGKHLARSYLWVGRAVKWGKYYDTLEILEYDAHLMDDGMKRAAAIGRDWNRRRAGAGTAGTDGREPGRAAGSGSDLSLAQPRPNGTDGGFAFDLR